MRQTQGGHEANTGLGKIVRPTLRLWGESRHRVLLTRQFGLSVAKWLRN